MNRTNVLDKGYVRLCDVYGGEISVVNAARASFKKESKTLSEKDHKLLNYLAKHGHTSPFRGSFGVWEVKAPLVVARQWFKYRIGSEHSGDTAELVGVPSKYVHAVLEYLFGGNGDDGGFSDTLYQRNEASHRYVSLDREFYIPSKWRKAPDNLKQGSGGLFDEHDSEYFTHNYEQLLIYVNSIYDSFLTLGVAPEMARLCLPSYALYTTWRWTASFQATAFFLSQRLKDDAQWETRQYAKAVYRLIKPHFSGLDLLL